MGRRLATTGQAGEQMPMPVRCDVQEGQQVGGAAGSTRAFLETARASSEPCTGKLWRKEKREKRPESIRQHFVLSTRDPLLLPRSPPFIGREGAVMSALFLVPFGQGSALIFAHPSHYIRRLVQLLGSRARSKDCSCGLRLELCQGPFLPTILLIRLYVLLSAPVREEPVPTPWCPNSTLGRFSSRQRKIRENS